MYVYVSVYSRCDVTLASRHSNHLIGSKRGVLHSPQATAPASIYVCAVIVFHSFAACWLGLAVAVAVAVAARFGVFFYLQSILVYFVISGIEGRNGVLGLFGGSASGYSEQIFFWFFRGKFRSTQVSFVREFTRTPFNRIGISQIKVAIN